MGRRKRRGGIYGAGKRRRRDRHSQRKGDPRSSSGGDEAAALAASLFRNGNEEWWRGQTILSFDQSQVTDEDWAAHRERLRTKARELPREIQASAERIAELIRELPTLPVLANLAMRSHVFDPDTYVESEGTQLPSFQVEWATAAALTLPAPVEGDANGRVLDISKFQALTEELDSFHRSLSMSIDLQPLRRGTEEFTAVNTIRAQTRRRELSFRGGEYHSQRQAMFRDLFAPFADDLTSLAGFDVSAALGVIDKIAGLVAQRLEHKLRDMKRSLPELREHLRSRGVSKKELNDAARTFAAVWCSSTVDSIYRIDIDDLGFAESEVAFLYEFSLPFGQSVPEAGPVLDVRRRPLLRISDRIYFAHLEFVLDLHLATGLEEILKRDQEVWEKYQAHRAALLEDLTVHHLSNAMPAAAFRRNLEFAGADGKRRELDVLGVMDRVLFLCECKAGRISSTDRYQARLGRDVKSVLSKAHRQAIEALEAIKQRPTCFTEKKTGKSVVVDADDYDYIFPIVVTLDDISAFTSNLAAAVDADLFSSTRPPWAVFIMDLELIADLCEFNVQLAHYIMRRVDLASNIRLQAIEEMDWFMFYLRQGLYFGPDPSDAGGVYLLSQTDELDAYYMWKEGTRSRPTHKPNLKTDYRFKRLIGELEDSRISGWTTGALGLLGYDSSVHDTVLRQLAALRKKRRPAGRVFCDSSTKGAAAIALFGSPSPLWNFPREFRDYAAARFVTDQLGLCVAVGVRSGSPDAPTYFHVLDARTDDLPTESEARKILSRFTGTFVRSPKAATGDE